MATPLAPDKRMLVRHPVRGGGLNRRDDLVPRLKPTPFKASERKVFHHGSIRFK